MKKIDLTTLATPTGRRLREARAAKGYNRAQLAALAELSPTAIYNLEHGLSRTPRPETMFKLAETLGVSLEWLVGD